MAVQESAEAIVPCPFGGGRAELLGAGRSTDRTTRMDVAPQQGTAYQLSLFGGEGEVVRSFGGGEGGSRSAPAGERQASTASEGYRALATAYLMERICERENLNRAYKRVKQNRGSAGVDGLSVHDLGPWRAAHREELGRGLL